MTRRVTPYGPPSDVKYRIYRRNGKYVLSWENADGSGVPQCDYSVSSISQFVKEVLIERFSDGTSCVFELDKADEPVDPELKLELVAAGAV